MKFPAHHKVNLIRKENSAGGNILKVGFQTTSLPKCFVPNSCGVTSKETDLIGLVELFIRTYNLILKLTQRHGGFPMAGLTSKAF